ncbi:MAG: replication protein [Balneola sp.]
MLGFEFTYTKVPNVILDYFMQCLTGAELTIMIFICRKTIGFQKKVDRIAYSTFVEGTGLTKPTIAMALKKLVTKQLIIKNESTTPHSYSLNEESIQIFEKLRRQVKNSSSGIVIKPTLVKNSNSLLVKELNTQKKTLKENEIKSTTTISDENYTKVCSYWNKLFGNSLNTNDLNLESIIKSAMQEFSVDQIIKAMFNRSRAEYYKIEKPYLRSNPKSFFKYPKTIENDLNRSPSKVYNYEEVCELVQNNNLDMSKDFIRLEEVLDDQGRALWQKI